MPSRTPASSSTLKVVYWGTRVFRIEVVAAENPHCGMAGVPFMKSTTRSEPTMPSMRSRTACSMGIGSPPRSMVV